MSKESARWVSNSDVIPMFPTLVWKVQLDPQLHKKIDAQVLAVLARSRDPLPPLAPGQGVRVIAQQYPSSEWAQYFAEYPAKRYNSFDNPKQHAIVVQFNTRVRSNQQERSPGQTWYALYYMWPNGTCVITVEYNTPDENLEIVRVYLEKYPSSIR